MQDRFTVFLNMVKHTTEITQKEFVSRVTLGVFLLNCLESTGFLGEDSSFQEKVFFARLALEFYHVILSNNHSVSFMVPTEECDENVELKK